MSERPQPLSWTLASRWSSRTPEGVQAGPPRRCHPVPQLRSDRGIDPLQGVGTGCRHSHRLLVELHGSILAMTVAERFALTEPLPLPRRTSPTPGPKPRNSRRLKSFTGLPERGCTPARDVWNPSGFVPVRAISPRVRSLRSRPWAVVGQPLRGTGTSRPPEMCAAWSNL